MEEAIVLRVDGAAVLAGAEQAFTGTSARTVFPDPNELHPDTWHAVRHCAGSAVP
ncbi:MAG: hypothetical protein M3Q10_06830 [Chloroflexota bacterium]|nr:hypothetical protein [Chloroflexota bacterium]